MFTHNEKKIDRKVGTCAVKLDMHKAYDRVEWVFLEQTMARFGFSGHWTKMVRRCVTSARFSVKMNCGLSHSFVPSRGLLQGILCLLISL